MIGKLKRYESKSVNGRKMMEIELRVPESSMVGDEVDGVRVSEFLNSRVGESVAFSVTATDEEQTRLDEML